MTRSVIARRALECVLLFGSLPLLMLWLIPANGWPWLLAFAGLALSSRRRRYAGASPD